MNKRAKITHIMTSPAISLIEVDPNEFSTEVHDALVNENCEITIVNMGHLTRHPSQHEHTLR